VHEKNIPGWHMDGHHSLIRWRIHGCIDGYSRLVLYHTKHKIITGVIQFWICILPLNNMDFHHVFAAIREEKTSKYVNIE